MVWLILLLFLIIILGYLTKIYLFNRKLDGFPSPPSNLLLGHSLHFLDVRKGFMFIIDDFMRKFGETIVIRIGLGKVMLVTADYKFMEFILPHAKLLKKSPDYDFLSRWLGTGLLLNKGDHKWKKHRKILTPAFHFKILEQYISVFHSASQTLIKKLKDQVGKESVNISPIISLCTLDVICETAMGVSVNAQEDEHSEYVQSVHEMCRIIIDRAFSPLKHYEILYFFTKDYQIEMKSLKILHGYSNTVIKAKLDKLNQGNEKQPLVDDVGLKKRRSFLDLLLTEMGPQNLTIEDIREEVDTFMFAGHDTTSTGVSFLLYNLAEHSHIQEKVFREQQNIFGDDLNRELNAQDLREMKYLELVIKETLRLYTPVPFIGRELERDVLYDGHVLPKGLDITLFSYKLHRNPKYFPDPEKFDPTRFENNVGEYPYAYIPFSSGPRNCIGQKFAMLSMKSIVSELVRKFEFLPTNPPHKLELHADTVLTSRSGIKIRIKNR